MMQSATGEMPAKKALANHVAFGMMFVVMMVNASPTQVVRTNMAWSMSQLAAEIQVA